MSRDALPSRTPQHPLVVVGTGPVARAVALSHVEAGCPVVIVSRDADRATGTVVAIRDTAIRRAASARRTDGGDGGSPSEAGAIEAATLAAAIAAARDHDAEGATRPARLDERPPGVPRATIIVAVPDRAVGEVGALIRAAAFRGLVLHTSGALAGSALGGGGPSGSLHPLQSFPAAAPPEDLRRRCHGAHWFHEGDGGEVARELVAAWRGVFHAIGPGGKSLYHAGAAVLSNHAVALYADALRLFAAAGIDSAAAAPALTALLAGTAANVAALGVPDALTGPVARGDVATVVGHLDAIRAGYADLLPAYVAMARRAAVLAREKGTLDASRAAELERALCAAEVRPA